jgi:hypothetical protein
MIAALTPRQAHMRSIVPQFWGISGWKRARVRVMGRA